MGPAENIAAASNMFATYPTEYNLGEDIEVERPGIAGRPVYYLRSGGYRVGVRKVASLLNEQVPGHFAATQNEMRVYDALVGRPGFRNHVVPYVRGIKKPNNLYLDFEWVPGMPLHDYLAVGTTAAREALAKAARSLAWLTAHNYNHGDIKADNFHVAEDGRVLLLDFGKATTLMPARYKADRTAFLAMADPYLGAHRSARLAALADALSWRDQPAFFLQAANLLHRYAKKQTRRRAKPRRTSSR